ncbi:hypothetical protein GCM10027612_26490 [Microbispora bryophytorum subsp. camponoti]
MDSALYVFVEDLRAEGVRGLLDRASAYGVRGVAVAAAYHQARDVTPHGASRLTLRRDGVHFPPPDDLFDGLRLTPPVQPGAQDRPIDELRRACADRGMRLHGWAVFLRNATLGLAHPDVTVENCFGDRGSPADLCPSHPDVRAYAVALARAVARQGWTRSSRSRCTSGPSPTSGASWRSARWTPSCSACASAPTACAGPPTSG